MSDHELGRKRRSQWELCADNREQEHSVHDNSASASDEHELDENESPPRKRRCRWEYPGTHETLAQERNTTPDNGHELSILHAPSQSGQAHNCQNDNEEEVMSGQSSIGEFGNGIEDHVIHDVPCRFPPDDAPNSDNGITNRMDASRK
ncbi:hypothetical protein FGB62_444g04 [Gracilaria domingensis]|nr:hypothetical protein FGB62_444g04 [Gracilaria domingensis]